MWGDDSLNDSKYLRIKTENEDFRNEAVEVPHEFICPITMVRYLSPRRPKTACTALQLD